MRSGLTGDLQFIDDARKTAVIDRELHRLNVDIAALQETRLPESRSPKVEHYTFFWQGKGTEDVREHGVGFAVRHTLLRMIEPPTDGTERILTLRLSSIQGPVILVCVYTPTLEATAEVKDQFYESLDTVISRIPAVEHIYLLGDFNARVGADHESWPDVLGHHGIGKMNENGQRLLELCCYRKLCVTNTYFQNKACHKVSWRHPRSKHWHQLDMIITKRDSLNNVCNIRSFHSADCNTDHSLIATKLKLKPKMFHHSKRIGQPRINTSKTAYPEKNREFNRHLDETLNTSHGERSVEESWTSLRTAIYGAAVLIYGKKER